MRKRCPVIAVMAIALPIGYLAIAISASAATTQAPASWATLDANSDGALSHDEVSGTPWADRFKQMDENGDGKVSKTEFGTYMKAMRKTQRIEKDKKENS